MLIASFWFTVWSFVVSANPYGINNVIGFVLCQLVTVSLVLFLLVLTVFSHQLHLVVCNSSLIFFNLRANYRENGLAMPQWPQRLLTALTVGAVLSVLVCDAISIVTDSARIQSVVDAYLCVAYCAQVGIMRSLSRKLLAQIERHQFGSRRP